MTQKIVQWIAIGFFAGLVALVFQQIHTSMTEQGIASGGPYDNAATFPKSVAIAIAGLLVIQIVMEFLISAAEPETTRMTELKRPALMLVVFALYLGLLTTLGYHLTTAPMVFAVMWICGARRVGALVLTSLAMAFSAAFIFERYLNVVLPGGNFSVHMPW